MRYFPCSPDKHIFRSPCIAFRCAQDAVLASPKRQLFARPKSAPCLKLSEVTNATSLMPSITLLCDKALPGTISCSLLPYLSPTLRAAHKKVPIQALRVRTRRVSTRKAHRRRNTRRRHRSRAISIINNLARRTGARFIHPPQSVGGFFDWEDLAGILLDPAVAFPDTAALARVLQFWEVGRTFGAEGFGEDVELFLVAGRDGKLDLDGAVDVVDWSAYTSGETGTALDGC